MCTFLLTHIIPRASHKLKRPTKNSFYLSSLITQKKVAMRFEGEKVQDIIYEITLFSYLDQDNELPIDQSISFLRVAHSV